MAKKNEGVSAKATHLGKIFAAMGESLAEFILQWAKTGLNFCRNGRELGGIFTAMFESWAGFLPQ